MTSGPAAADRELRAEAVVAAPPAVVWSLLADVATMRHLSPELVAMVPLGPGGLRPGRWYVGVNRRGAVVWPSRSRVTDVEPGRRLAWDTPTSGARWIWELAPEGEGTRVVHRRPVPRRLSRASEVFAALLLGGVSGHADELEAGMATSVARLATLAESAGAGAHPAGRG